MSFDPRSLERLRQLGRQLPEALPTPENDTKRSGKVSRPRHKVETEQDPKALFHELMQVSQDGTVPEHLMARLRDAEERIESERRQTLNSPASSAETSTSPAPPAPPAPSPGRTSEVHSKVGESETSGRH